MPDVFLSYSRRDSEFVGRLAGSIQSRGKTVWIDTDGIGDGEVFPQAIRAAIEQSDAFVFVITPEAAASTFCENEVGYAAELQKRLVPVLRAPVPDPALPAAIRERNWIPFTEEQAFDEAVDRLVAALDTDVEYAKEHTRWLVKALEWDAEGRDRSFLLRGSELKAAEAWLARSGEESTPAPTALQREYVFASVAASSRRQRLALGVSLGIATVSLALLVFALVSRSQAVSAKVTARSRALSAESQTQLQVDPELSILLGIEAVRERATPEALFALRDALDESPLRLRLPAQGPQQCGTFGGPGLAYSPDGTRLAEGLCDGDLVFLASAGGAALRRVHVAGRVPAVAYDPLGALLAAGTSRGVRLLDPASGALRETLPATGPVNALAFSPDGRRLAATTDAGVDEWSLRTGTRRVLARGAEEFHSLGFAAGGRRLVVGSVHGASVYDAGSGRLLRSLRLGETDAVALDPRGPLLALFTYTGNAGVVSLWDTRRWRRTATLTRLDEVQGTTLAFSPDGTELAVGAADGTAGLWSVRTRQELVSFLGSTTAVSAVAFSPDGRRVATGSSDGSARVWRAVGNERRDLDTDSSGLDDLVLARDRIVEAVYTNAIVVREIRITDGRRLGSLVVYPNANAGAFLSPDGRLVAVDPLGVRSRVAIWSIPARRVTRRLPPLVPGSLGFSPDSRRLAVAAAQGPSRIFDLASGGSLLLAGATPHCPPGWRPVAFSPDGRLVAAGTFCGQVVVWDARTGRRVEAFAIGGQISSLAFGRGGRTLAVGSWDSTVTIWDVPARRRDRVLAGHTRGVSSLAFSPDGSLLVTAGLDHTARVWDTRTWRTLRILRHPDAAGPPVFSRDGRTLITDDSAGTLRVWDPCTGCENAKVLLRIAQARATRSLTPTERATFLAGF